jgi:hypothetical protein
MNAPAVLRLEPFQGERVGNGSRVKSMSLVSDHQPESLSPFAPAANLNQFVGVHCIAVDHSIVQSLAKGQFHGELVALDAAPSFDDSCQLLDHW